MKLLSVLESIPRRRLRFSPRRLRILDLALKRRDFTADSEMLNETDTFFVDESWLKLESAESRSPREGLSTLVTREVEIIEAALADCNGRIDGPSGAAATLRIPRSTLESKIRRFGINKYLMKGQSS